MLRLVRHMSEPHRSIVGLQTVSVGTLTQNLHGSYEKDPSTIDMLLLQQIGGLSYILDLFVNERSLESTEALFAVIYDCILFHLDQSKHIAISKGT